MINGVDRELQTGRTGIEDDDDFTHGPPVPPDQVQVVRCHRIGGGAPLPLDFGPTKANSAEVDVERAPIGFPLTTDGASVLLGTTHAVVPATFASTFAGPYGPQPVARTIVGTLPR